MKTKLALLLSLILIGSAGSVHAKKAGNDAFKKLDTDGDGKISQAEFTKGKKKSSKAEAAFKAKDKDNDGFLTEEEFKGHGKKKKNK